MYWLWLFCLYSFLGYPLEVRAFNVLAGVTFIFVLPALTAFQFVTAKFKLTFNADTVLFVNRLPPINRIYSIIHN